MEARLNAQAEPSIKTMIVQHFALIASGVLVVFCAVRILILQQGT